MFAFHSLLTLCRRLVSVSIFLGLAACAIPVAKVTPSGQLNVLGPASGFTVAAPPPGWILSGDASEIESHMRVVEKDGFPALRLDPADSAFLFVRRTQAIMMASPYLSWAWNMEAAILPSYVKRQTENTSHPMQIIVGFHGGAPKSRSWGSRPLAWLGSDLPPHDRAFALTWGASALQRGSFLPTPKTDKKALNRYVVRGGRKRADTWQLETVDLSRIYTRLWPNTPMQDVRIVFIGVAMAPAPQTTPTRAGYVSGIMLTR